MSLFLEYLQKCIQVHKSNRRQMLYKKDRLKNELLR